MSKEITLISPEGMEIANSYLSCGSIEKVCQSLQILESKVVEYLNKTEVKRYLNTIFLDRGYRNRERIGALVDEMIESKLEEALETGIYTKKDLADLIMMAHKMRMDEIKAQDNSINIKNQTNVQINDGAPLGLGGNYGNLIKQLVAEE